MDGFADAVAERIAALPGGRAAVGGLSLGGYVALALAARHPERVAALVLANTRAEPDTEEAAAGPPRGRRARCAPGGLAAVPRRLRPADGRARRPRRARTRPRDRRRPGPGGRRRGARGAGRPRRPPPRPARHGRARPRDRRARRTGSRRPRSPRRWSPPCPTPALTSSRGRATSPRSSGPRSGPRPCAPSSPSGWTPPAWAGVEAVAAVVRRRLRAGAADLHRAPPAAAVAARVQVEHRTSLRGALAHAARASRARRSRASRTAGTSRQPELRAAGVKRGVSVSGSTQRRPGVVSSHRSAMLATAGASDADQGGRQRRRAGAAPTRARGARSRPAVRQPGRDEPAREVVRGGEEIILAQLGIAQVERGTGGDQDEGSAAHHRLTVQVSGRILTGKPVSQWLTGAPRCRLSRPQSNSPSIVPARAPR